MLSVENKEKLFMIQPRPALQITLNEIEILVKENVKLTKLLQQNGNKSFNTGSLTPILKQLLINAEKMPQFILLNEGTLRF